MLHPTHNTMNVFKRCSGTVERHDLDPQSKSEIKTRQFIRSLCAYILLGSILIICDLMRGDIA